VLLVLVTVWTLKVGPLAPPSTAAGLSFDSAATVAQGVASSYPGGPWSVIGAYGSQFSSGFTPDASWGGDQGFRGFGCNSTTLLSDRTVTVPATPIEPSSGLAESWSVEFEGNASLLLVGVEGGNAFPLQLFTGANCVLAPSSSDPTLPPGTLDSPKIAALAATPPASEFAADRSRFDVEYILSPEEVELVSGQRIVRGPTWAVELTNCDLAG
jgi:hypothetical protein